MIGLLKYVRHFYRPARGDVLIEQSTHVRDGVELPALVFRPARARGRLPAWVVLHGMTYHGPRHPSLQRFATSLAASGHVVIVPEIVEWTRLKVTPHLTGPTIIAGANALAERSDVDADRVGVFGFSFGATQGLVSATNEDVARRIRAFVAWGGYSDINRVMHFGMTGDHDIDGVQEHIDPDPYGRWIFAANYLTKVPGYEHETGVADALMELALEAGRSGTFAGDRIHEPTKRALADRFTGRTREVFELFAPTVTHDVPAAAALAAQLADAVRRTDPLMDPQPHFPNVRVPVLLAHGRDDLLVPYSETVRMRRMLPADKVRGYNITSLFAHSGTARHGLDWLGVGREAVAFGSILNRILTTL